MRSSSASSSATFLLSAKASKTGPTGTHPELLSLLLSLADVIDADFLTLPWGFVSTVCLRQ